jgi:ketose-bisphosphate aldolase
MALVPIPDMMEHCRSEKYAIGYFESWNLESLQGVIDAAEQSQSPIIVGFNGEFLSHDQRLVDERLDLYAKLGRAAAEASSVPCGLIFNECPVDAWTRSAVEQGFTLVMPVDSSGSLDEYIERLRSIVEYAHAHQVAVEAEWGELPSGASGRVNDEGFTTDPEMAARLVDETGIDLLAVSVGNVHIQLNGDSDLDLEHLVKLRARISVPLVLHGGTGISATSLQAAIDIGVRKVNYGTYLKQRYLQRISSMLSAKDRSVNPHELLGMGGPDDLLVAGRLAVRDAVLERIELLGCCGKADDYAVSR